MRRFYSLLAENQNDKNHKKAAAQLFGHILKREGQENQRDKEQEEDGE